MAGRAWQVGQIDWNKGVMHVSPAEHGRVPSWLGLPGVLSAPLCQAMKGVLTQEGEEAHWLTRSAANELEALRAGYAPILEQGDAPFEESSDD